MCGIVGIIGKADAPASLIQGLAKLEYRGYDSAGIYVSDSSKDGHLVKAVGRISQLKEKLTPTIKGTIGIGHTRWATHGRPTEENAHPHVSSSQRYVLVHNGVIENFKTLRETYLKKVSLQGETDTEIVVCLIDYFSQQGLTTKAAFKAALSKIKGSYAFALVDTEDPTTIYAAKNKSPLLIGTSVNFNVICSDAMAMLHETNQFIEIHDGEVVVLTATDIQIENAQGEVITRPSYEAQLDLNDIEKGTYPYYMLKEIDEQPAVMRKIIQEYTTLTGGVTLDAELLAGIAASDRLYIVACGTSYHAGLIGKQLLESIAGIAVEVHLSSEFGYHLPLLSEKPFFIFLSQSGETADSRQVLVKTNQLGYPSLTLTNVAGSTLAREAQASLLLHAGPEIAVASTKAYTAQVAVLAVLAKAIGMTRSRAEAAAFDCAHELSVVATAMETLIDEKHVVEQLAAAYLTDTRNAFYIGRGVDYAVSLEAALKLKEISYIQAEGFAAGELKHGPIALIEEGTPVIGFITDQVTASHTRGNLKEVESRGANVLAVAMESLAHEEDQLVLPEVHPLLTALVSMVPAQLLAYFATLQRGYDVDKPRNLAKSVTVE